MKFSQKVYWGGFAFPPPVNPVNLKRNQPWTLIAKTDAEAPVFSSSDANRQLTRKVPDAGKDQKQKEKRAAEDKMFGWHHWYNGHEFWQVVQDKEA